MISKDLLAGEWRHSYEEDTPEVAVYRNLDFDFPRSRGRDAIKLASDGSAIDLPIGNTDGNAQHRGDWNVTSDNVLQVSAPDGKLLRQMKIEEVSDGRMVCRKGK